MRMLGSHSAKGLKYISPKKKGNYILESLGVKMADETENLAYEILGDEGSEACCPRCGKPYEDFSDLGCGYCDSRSAEWGIE